MNTTVKKYGGLFVVILLVFLLAGCSAETPKKDPNSADRCTDGSTIPSEKGRGSGTLR